jgi:chemotaxis methyl-accepting protein methylase
VRRPAADTVYRGDVRRLLDKIVDRSGLDLAQYRQTYVERRLASRVRALGLHSYRQYARHLDAHPEEYDRMLRALTINVTEFFRDASVYAVFRERVVPALIEAKRDDQVCRIHVWSAGCATGEEPYSIAMTLLDALPPGSACSIRVTGTDLDPEALETARAGRYDSSKLDQVPDAIRESHLRLEDGGFGIADDVAAVVRFERSNLFTDRPPGSVDVVFCRNVFIYLTKEQQARLLDVFATALAPGGFLVLGRSEKLAPSAAAAFEALAGNERVYRRIGAPKRRGRIEGVE